MEESLDVAKCKKDDLKKEIADIGTYLIYMCNELGIDLVEAMEEKMTISESKYPVEKAKGNSKKYNEF
jgi:NTP pyrophosphatase (non-canonical NTP hydrolase)